MSTSKTLGAIPPVNTHKGSAYYQSLYVKQGRSGLFRDSAGCEMLQRDVLAIQKELARRLLTDLADNEEENCENELP